MKSLDSHLRFWSEQFWDFFPNETRKNSISHHPLIFSLLRILTTIITTPLPELKILLKKIAHVFETRTGMKM